MLPNNETKITIVNTGVGNVRSVSNMLKRHGVKALISNDHADLANAHGIILPGVGSFDAAMRKFRSSGMAELLTEMANMHGKPIMGLCLGMQLMCEGSEEGNETGLGWIPGYFKKLPTDGEDGSTVMVPHMGWNTVTQVEKLRLYENMGNEVRFYFDHSYYYSGDSKYAYGLSHHGIHFAAGIRSDNLFGFQFHPEKSHRFGFALFGNFLSYVRKEAGLVSSA